MRRDHGLIRALAAGIHQKFSTDDRLFRLRNAIGFNGQVCIITSDDDDFVGHDGGQVELIICNSLALCNEA